MAATVAHIFTSPIADGTNTQLVRPGDWNSVHAVSVEAIAGVVASDATYTSGTIYFSGQNNLTVGSSVNGASQYVRLSVGNYLTTAMASNRGSDFVAATAAFAGTSASGTIASNGISVSIGPYLTTAGLSGDTTKYNQNWKLTGNTAGTTSSAQGTDVWYEGGNSITVSGNSNTIKFSVGAYITTADLSANSSKYNQNWKLTGNTAGTTSSAQGTDLWFQGGNSLTVSGSSNSIVFSVGAYITTADLSANSSKYMQNWKVTGNTSGTSSSAQGTDLWFSGLNQTVSGNSNTIVLSVPATSSLVGSSGISISTNGSTISVYQPVASEYDPFPGQQPITNSTLGVSTLYFAPFEVAHMISASRVNFFHSVGTTLSGAPANSTAWLGAGYGLYTRMTGTGTDRMSLLTSYSMSYISASASSSTRFSATNYWQISNGTTHSTSQYGTQDATASNYLISSLAGFRVVAFPISSLLTPGRYWMGYSAQVSNQGASLVLSHTVLQYQFSNNLAFRPFNVSSVASNGSNWGANIGAGVYSAQSAGWPVSIALTTTAISLAPIVTFPMFNFSGISQSSNVL